MYGETKINEELTKATYGYYSTELKKSAQDKIVVTCTNCSRNIHKQYRYVESRHRCPSVEGSNKRCFKCGEWKDLSLFNKNPRGSGCVGKLCRDCYNKESSVKDAIERKKRKKRWCFDSGDIITYMHYRLKAIQTGAKKRGIECDIDETFMLDLFNSQNGLCYYTKIPMSNKYKRSGFQCWDIPSLDRIDSTKGYTKDNVVWCCFGVNAFKLSLSLEEFKHLVQSCQWWCI